jgi:hypothetical protein
MKFVWVLTEHHDYEGGEVVGCYDSIEAGMTAAGGEWNRDPWGRYAPTCWKTTRNAKKRLVSNRRGKRRDEARTMKGLH